MRPSTTPDAPGWAPTRDAKCLFIDHRREHRTRFSNDYADTPLKWRRYAIASFRTYRANVLVNRCPEGVYQGVIATFFRGAPDWMRKMEGSCIIRPLRSIAHSHEGCVVFQIV